MCPPYLYQNKFTPLVPFSCFLDAILDWNAFVGRSSRTLLALWCRVLGSTRSLVCQAGALGLEGHGGEERDPLTFPRAGCWHRLGASGRGSPFSSNVLSPDAKFAPVMVLLCCCCPAALSSAYLEPTQFNNWIHRFKSHT